MKKYYYCLFVFLLFFQCQNDIVREDFLSRKVSLEAIKVDSDFTEFVNASQQFAKLIYYRRGTLYDKKNIKNPFVKIEESRARINGYLNGSLSKEEVPLILKEYNISHDQATNLIGRMMVSVALLERKFGEGALQKLNRDELNIAIEYAQNKLSGSESKAKEMDYCVQCPYANCENCGPGQNPGEGIDNGGIDEILGGGDSGTNCVRVRQIAANKRDSTIANAWREFAAETIVCAGSAQQAAVNLYGATWYLAALGPEAPFAIAALGAVGVGGTCMWAAASRLDSNLQIAQSDYQLDVMGQGCNP
ncbi:hypothetical protein [Spirosoma endbachense]|uniref:Uncharacterized protein n=1 Tax=Spirosoma endbachense TaxID=2666025 RepID=A0A6P1VPW7_9BACT|nr:hypothetical protein [Spirosoma endbachense]QHV94020.1 hypothetical protein GJR95_02805 [Spirosoma endbachense]